MSAFAASIATCCQKHMLPGALVEAIIKVESGGDAWAFRFEQGFYEKYVVNSGRKPIVPCSLPTEKIGLATSWGPMQIMGLTARERGFTGPFLSELCEPGLGIEFGCRQLAWLMAKHKALDGWRGVTAAYNAGSPRYIGLDGEFVNQGYVDKVLLQLGGSWPI